MRWPWSPRRVSDSEIEDAIRTVFGKVLPTPTRVHGPDTFRNLLAFFLISSFVGTLPALVLFPMPGENKDIIVYVIGQLSGMATMALGFYFTQKAGQDNLDAKRSETQSKLADAVLASAQGSGAQEPAKAAANAADKVVKGAEEARDEVKDGNNVDSGG